MEPVAELVNALRGPVDRLPLVELVQVAMGESEVRGADVHVFSVTERDRLLQKVSDEKRPAAKRELDYLVNMSSKGGAHPRLPSQHQWFAAEYGIHVDVEKRQTEVWTWRGLAERCNFAGCEVLVIDTEGSDAEILRSMIEYCQRTPSAWPDLIQFETMGHCDEKEGRGTERRLIETLEKEGYKLVNSGDHNSHLVLSSALDTEQRLQDWVGAWRCTSCWKPWCLPFTSNHEGCYCQPCLDRKMVQTRARSSSSSLTWPGSTGGVAGGFGLVHGS